jgi:hypothetical protein
MSNAGLAIFAEKPSSARKEQSKHGTGGRKMEKPDCQHCRYRYWLRELCDIHVDMHDCDKYGQDLCKKMNDPEFIKFMEEMK